MQLAMCYVHVQVIYMVAMVFILECSIAGDTHTLSLTCPAVYVQ